MTWFAINNYKGWRRDFARFEAAIELKGLRASELNENVDEIFICVITHSDEENAMVIEAAQKYFGQSFNGLIS